MSTLQERIQADIKTAMKARQKERVDALRLLRASIQTTQQEADKEQYDAATRAIATQHPDDAAARDAALEALTLEPVVVDDAMVTAVLRREVKRRRDAAKLYADAGKPDEQAKEEAEAAILEEYLPRQLSADELRPQVAAVIAELGVQGTGNMGRLMPVLIERFGDNADGRTLSTLARELLTQ